MSKLFFLPNMPTVSTNVQHEYPYFSSFIHVSDHQEYFSKVNHLLAVESKLLTIGRR